MASGRCGPKGGRAAMPCTAVTKSMHERFRRPICDGDLFFRSFSLPPPPALSSTKTTKTSQAPSRPLGLSPRPRPPHRSVSLSLRARRARRARLHHRHRRPHDRNVPLITSAFQPVLQSLIVTRPPTGSFLRRSLPHTLAVLSPFLHHAHLTPPPSPPRRYRLHPWP